MRGEAAVGLQTPEKPPVEEPEAPAAGVAAAAGPPTMELRSAAGLSIEAVLSPAAAPRRPTGGRESNDGAASRRIDHQGNAFIMDVVLYVSFSVGKM